jgi:uncharacterized protein
MTAAPPPPPASAPDRVRAPVNVHRWDDISFLHWPVDPAAIQACLPRGLRVHSWDGAGWIGVTPFRMQVQQVGPIPLTDTFPETNVRTYVTDERGRDGIWFLHMEVTSAWFAIALRTLGLPYHRRRMHVEHDSNVIRYRSQDERADCESHDIAVRVEPGTARPADSPLERYLLARWTGYHRAGPLLLRTPVEHPTWEILPATTKHAHVSGLFHALGLPAPQDPPLTHFSPGVQARIGMTKPVRR